MQCFRKKETIHQINILLLSACFFKTYLYQKRDLSFSYMFTKVTNRLQCGVIKFKTFIYFYFFRGGGGHEKEHTDDNCVFNL